MTTQSSLMLHRRQNSSQLLKIVFSFDKDLFSGLS